ncbi:MAG TPA: Calx-beta domain-containing protein [Actinomycetota bacterium]|nr:Calx-beta domain-containing protein [Actinomycetota bacterium]
MKTTPVGATHPHPNVHPHRRPIRRLAGTTVALALLLLALPVPATAAPVPSVTITDVTVIEGTGGTATANFTIQAAPQPKACCPLQVSWATAPGSATAPDFTSASGTVSLAKGSAAKVVSVTVAGDAIDESTETFTVNLSNLVGTPGRLRDAQGVGTITDDDQPPSLAVDDVALAEGDSGTANLTFTASLSSSSALPVTFDWATAPGTATAPADFTSASGSRTIAAGSSSATINVAVRGDTLDEEDETFSLALSNPGNATIGDGSGTGTITDDDPLSLLSLDDPSVVEGDAGTATLTFTASLSAVSAKAVSFDWATSAGTATAGTDYVEASGVGAIPAGSTSTSIDVTVNADTLDEVDETLTLTLSDEVNATIDDGAGLGSITDDDPLVVADIGDASISEGDAGTSSLAFDVTLSAASAKTVTVDWTTQDDLARAPDDYVAGSGTLTFVPGDTTESASVTINGDGIAELDEEFHVILSAPSNTTLGDADALGTIVDDELMPVLDIDEPSIAEGQSGTTTLTFSVTLSHPSAIPVSADWTTTAGTAAAGSDFVTDDGTLNFAAMDTSETVEVTVNGDGTYELDETVLLDLVNPQGAPVGDPQGIGTIENDDAAPALSVGDVSKAEGNAGTSTLSFVVTLTGASDVDATVDFATSNGTAVAGADYTASSGTVTIPAGVTSGAVDVPILGDGTWEPAETLTLTLSGSAHASLGDPVALGRIRNDDRRPTAITLRVVREPRVVIATGLLEPTKWGHRVTATLFRKQNGRFVRIASKSVAVRYFGDRDGDGKKDGRYRVRFDRPRKGATYRVIARFKGTTTHLPSQRVRVFPLRAT